MPPSLPEETASFSIVPVTEKYAAAFYNLIQEQAEQHSSVSQGNRAEESVKLFKAVHETKEVQAFLVLDEQRGQPACAVTYFDCWTERGSGLYLEDIVTTKAQRGRGVGHFAMTALAQATLQKGYKCLAWECAANNLVAHRFYDSFSSERHSDKLTWRLMGPFAPPRTKANSRAIQVTCSDRKALSLPEDVLGLDPAHPDMFVLAVPGRAGSVLARSIAYRNYSTFRLVSGMHIETFSVGENSENAAAMIEAQIRFQAEKGWIGHIDLTLSKEEGERISPILSQYGFVPLSYGQDCMVPRSLHGERLRDVAGRKRNLTKALCDEQGVLLASDSPSTMALRPREERSRHDAMFLSSCL